MSFLKLGKKQLLQRFLIHVILLMIIGLIMIYSSSYMFGKESFGSSSYFFVRQLFFSIFGIGLVLLMSKTKIQFWLKYSFHIQLFMCIVLGMTFIPGIGLSVKGASRWISFYGIGFQPGEMVKYTLILSSVIYFEYFYLYTKKEKVQYAFIIITPMFIFLGQPDYGSFTICFLVICFVAFVSNFSRRNFYSIVGLGSLVGIIFLFTESYRIKRILGFIDPWKNPKSSGFQIIQSFLAFANGSVFGQGLGNSNEKLFYLPEAHNDFIFSVIGEELGVVGVSVVIFLFLSFLLVGFRLSFVMSSRVFLSLCSAVVFTIGLQALLNMGVVLGLLPTKGLNLPFISYGGSSLVSNLFGIGLLYSAVSCSNEIIAAPAYKRLSVENGSL
jgi:cell division protein FtsW